MKFNVNDFPEVAEDFERINNDFLGRRVRLDESLNCLACFFDNKKQLSAEELGKHIEEIEYLSWLISNGLDMLYWAYSQMKKTNTSVEKI